MPLRSAQPERPAADVLLAADGVAVLRDGHRRDFVFVSDLIDLLVQSIDGAGGPVRRVQRRGLLHRRALRGSGANPRHHPRPAGRGPTTRRGRRVHAIDPAGPPDFGWGTTVPWRTASARRSSTTSVSASPTRTRLLEQLRDGPGLGPGCSSARRRRSRHASAATSSARSSAAGPRRWWWSTTSSRPAGPMSSICLGDLRPGLDRQPAGPCRPDR